MTKPVSILPLITFRIIFGLLMFAGTIRFWAHGWIESIYLQPIYHFPYPGFEWVRSPGEIAIYALFVIMIISSLMIAIGFLYRFAAFTFFISFTYVELIDVTIYLNHYYLVSLFAFLLMLVPANASYSVDVLLRRRKKLIMVPAWCVGIFRFQLAVVYIFAGLAKLDPDWMLRALPMKIWLPAKSDMPIIGTLLLKEWVAYFFSWFGLLYDLFIVGFLMYKTTRPYAYLVVVIFHLATALFFPAIGMFPYLMIFFTLLYFDENFHKKALAWLPSDRSDAPVEGFFKTPSFLKLLVIVYCVIQLVLPLRFLFYPGKLFWGEEGFRFSWRVMLMEKSGIAYFTVKDSSSGKLVRIDNGAFLTPFQEKMMATQPDMILNFAHFLASEYQKKGLKNPEVYAEAYVSLNGRRSTMLIDSAVDLASKKLSLKHADWILPLGDKSTGH